MIKIIKSMHRFANRHAGLLFVFGLFCVGLFNWRKWQGDKAMLEEIKGRTKIPPLEEWPDLPTVSVLVAAWNESKLIQRHIESFQRLRYPHKELILVAGGPDGTFSLAEHYVGEQVKVLKQKPGEGKHIALKQALPNSTGEVIFLTDADCILNSASFEMLLYPIAKGDETVTSGISRPFSEQIKHPFVFYQWVPQRYGELLQNKRYVGGLLGRNCALKRSVLLKAWDSNVQVSTGTDYYLALRILENGNRIRHIQGSFVESFYPENFNLYVNQQTRWLKNLIVWGYRFQDYYHLQFGMSTAIIGLSLLMMPLFPVFLGEIGICIWLLSWGSVIQFRLRYRRMIIQVEKLLVSASVRAFLSVMLADFVAWSRVLVEIPIRSWQKRW